MIKVNIYDLLGEIHSNWQDEHEAIAGYYKLLNFAVLANDAILVTDIEEIISDELNHAERLKEAHERYSKIRAAID